MKRKVHWAALAVCGATVLALAGCGGGGGGDDTPAAVVPPPQPAANTQPVDPPISVPVEKEPTPDTPNTPNPPPDQSAGNKPNLPSKPPADIAPKGIEGIWSSNMQIGIVSGTYASRMIILDDGSLWGNYGTRSLGFYKISGMLHGRAKAQNDNNVAALFVQYDVTDPAASKLNSFSGSLVDQSILSLTLGDGTALQLGYDKRYEQPVSLEAASARSLIQGLHTGTAAFSGQTVFGQGSAWIVISDSTLTTDSFFRGSNIMKDCAIRGTLAPRGTAGVFNTQLTFSGAGCAAGDGATYSGIVYFLGDRSHFEIMAVTPDGRNAFYFMSDF